jgi:hypothetical protein
MLVRLYGVSADYILGIDEDRVLEYGDENEL